MPSEDGELEEGELPEDETQSINAEEAPAQLSAAPSATDASGTPATSAKPRADPDPASSPPAVDPYSRSGSLHGSPLHDAPVRTYGSGLVLSGYGASPYASVPSMLDRRHSSLRGHPSTSYDSPRATHHASNGYFDARQMAYRDRTSSNHSSRYQDEHRESSRSHRTVTPVEEYSSDEGELPSSSRGTKRGSRGTTRLREVHVIIGSLQSMTSAVAVPSAMKSLETVSLDLKAALADLEDLQEALSADDTPATADSNSELGNMANRYFKGLRSVHVVCNTGIAKTAKLEAAGELVRATIAVQETLLTTAHQKELEGWLKSSKVFKALADGEEDSIQPKRPQVEPKPRSPYVPKPKTPQVPKPKTPQPPKQPQNQGQKKQGQQQGNQNGPKGKKQKLNGQASKANTNAKAHKGQAAAPLPLPVDASAHSMQNGRSSSHAVKDQSQALGEQSIPGPPAPPGDSAVLPLDLPFADDASQPRAQVGFKLAGTKKQKIRLAPEEDPRTAAMHQRLRLHMAKQQQEQQEEQAQQLEHSRSVHVDTTQQAATDAPVHDVSTGDAVAVDIDAQGNYLSHQRSAASVGQDTLLPTYAQGWSMGSSSLPPGLQSPDKHVQADLPQLVHQQLPAAVEPAPSQAQLLGQHQHQLPGQLPQESSRGMHRRRSRRSHKFDDILLAGQAHSAADTSLNNHADPGAQSWDQSQYLQPAHVTQLPRQEQHQQATQQQALQSRARQDWQQPQSLQEPWLDARAGRSSSPVLADLAEHGGPVAIANGSAGSIAKAGAQLEVLADDVKSVLRQGKLCLVLDLDHTLINSARFMEVDPEHDAMLRHHMAAEAIRHPEERRELFRVDRIQMWTKLRPAVRQFLEAAHEEFELWIHTNGNRSYAAAIVEILDPSGRLFGHRIISQGAAGDGAQQDLTKRLMQGLEGRESIALVVDDTSSVWENHEENLFAVERYIYFPASRRQFNSKSKSLLEQRRDETPSTGMLMTALNVLRRTHARFFRVLAAAGGVERAVYQNHGPRALWDVREVLTEERRQVLSGVHIMFSRIIPLQEDPERHPLWRKAVRFGASCTTQPSDAVTHVVTYVTGTEKVYWAQHNGKFVVTPEWLNCSATLWKRAPEQAYPVTATA